MSENTSFRNVRKHSFTQVSNDLLNDPDVTLQAKGLLIIFLSNTEDWKIQMPEIIKRSKNGRDAQYKILNELIKHGYVARVVYRDKKTKRFVKQEYIFSDNKNEVKDVLKEVEQLGNEQNLITVVSYKIDKSEVSKEPNTENQETEENQDTNPFPDSPDVGISNQENQYINNTKENNTNNKNTNNNLNNMDNLKESNEIEKQAGYSSNTSNHSQKSVERMSEEQYKKEMSFNRYPKAIYLQLQRLDYQDAKELMDITNKAKTAVTKEYDDMKRDNIDFSYEYHESEISQVMNRMILKAKYENVSITHLSRFISRSIQNYYREYAEHVLQEIIERDMMDASKDMMNGNFNLQNN